MTRRATRVLKKIKSRTTGRGKYSIQYQDIGYSLWSIITVYDAEKRQVSNAIDVPSGQDTKNMPVTIMYEWRYRGSLPFTLNIQRVKSPKHVVNDVSDPMYTSVVHTLCGWLCDTHSAMHWVTERSFHAMHRWRRVAESLSMRVGMYH